MVNQAQNQSNMKFDKKNNAQKFRQPQGGTKGSAGANKTPDASTKEQVSNYVEEGNPNTQKTPQSQAETTEQKNAAQQGQNNPQYHAQQKDKKHSDKDKGSCGCESGEKQGPSDSIYDAEDDDEQGIV